MAGNESLEKEFELERMILFSDAVFAIAITLLVIDIKWPEIPAASAGVSLNKLFGPTIQQFFAFALSFFFIGRSWSLHLRLFKQLRQYDQRLINLNLFFLFFIVTFPFTASGIASHARPGFPIPTLLYVLNLTAVAVVHFFIGRYIFRVKPALSMADEEAEKKYLYLRGKYHAIGMTVIFIAMVSAVIVFRNHDAYLAYCLTILPLYITYINRKARKNSLKTTTR